MNEHILLPALPERPDLHVRTLVIGGGIAGFRAAIESSRVGPVLLVTKDSLTESNTMHAQGGVAAALGEDDSLDAHREDTLRAGGNLCEPEAVDTVVREGPELLLELMEWGGRFDRDGDHLRLGREAGHSHHRIVHARGDATGREVVATLLRRVRSESAIRLRDHTFVVDLLVVEGRCCGAVMLSHEGRPLVVTAGNTILCTGGAGQLYRETTNPPIATGDGVAMAFRAGAEVADLEFVQFHPTTLYIAGSSRKLITEAVRGAGGRLVDRDGERFAFRYHQDGELAPRDVVSRAIVQHLQVTKDSCVFLDLSILGEWVRERFPGLNELCRLYGLDITRDPIPVHPSAHYMVGGCFADEMGRTSLPGLYAAGEAALSGLHGANRLASNSLLEGLVFGRRAGEHAARNPGPRVERIEAAPARRELSPAVFNVPDMLNSLKSLMWRQVGIMRRGDHLEEALEQLEGWHAFVRRIRFEAVEGLELTNLLQLAVLVARGALWRCETRGTHCRTDHPETDDERFRAHSVHGPSGEIIGRPLR